jgi:predicted nucleic-acid-binding protein
MRAVDTNVLVRLITHDDERQLAVAEAFMATAVWVSDVVLAETIWVLETAYNFEPGRIAVALDIFLKHENVTLQDADVVAAALDLYRGNTKVGFTDCLVLEIARKAGHLPLGTFDRDLSKLDGAQRL